MGSQRARNDWETFTSRLLFMTVSKSIDVSTNDPVSFLFYDWVIFCLRMYHIFFIYTSVGGQLGCFHVLAIINSTAMNIDIPVFFSGITSFSGYIASSGITGPYGSFIFSFPLRNLHTVLHNECIIQCECIMYIHTNSTEGFPFLNTFSSIYCL